MLAPHDLPRLTGCDFCDEHGLTGPAHWPHSDHPHDDNGYRDLGRTYDGPYGAPLS